MEEQSKPEREGKAQQIPQENKPKIETKGTSADIGMISKGSSGEPKAAADKDKNSTRKD